MDKAYNVFICPKCGFVGYSESENAYCTRCGDPCMVRTGYNLDQWRAMSDEQRKAEVERRRIVTPPNVNAPVQPPVLPSGHPTVRPSGWIRLLKVFTIIIMIIGIIASIIYGFHMRRELDSTFIGVVYMIAGILASILSVAGVMVFLEMAEDVRAMRAMMESRR